MMVDVAFQQSRGKPANLVSGAVCHGAAKWNTVPVPVTPVTQTLTGKFVPVTHPSH
jgi:hypothetical protein